MAPPLTPRRVTFTFDARSLETLAQLQARGIVFDTIPITDPVSGETRTLQVPRLGRVACPCCHGGHAHVDKEAP